jgi:hypothetical protein
MRFYAQRHRNNAALILARALDARVHSGRRRQGLVHSGLTAGSKAAPVEWQAAVNVRCLEGVELSALKVMLGGPRFVGPDAERRAPAVGAEVMLDPAGIEGVSCEVGLRGGEAQLLARHEPEKVTALATD